MPGELPEIEISLRANELRTSEQARSILDKPSGRAWHVAMAMLPPIAQALFPDAISALVGLPSTATWLVILILAQLAYLTGEVAMLRQQLKALRCLYGQNEKTSARTSLGQAA